MCKEKPRLKRFHGCYIPVNLDRAQESFSRSGDMSRIEKIAFGLVMLSAAAPAFAGRAVPAPIAGAGIGAVFLVGVGYRALKSRIGR